MPGATRLGLARPSPILLSGFMTPVAAMPGWLQPIAAINPMHHFVDVSRAVLLCGAGFAEVGSSIAWLAGIGATVIGLAALRFHRTLA